MSCDSDALALSLLLSIRSNYGIDDLRSFTFSVIESALRFGFTAFITSKN